MSSTSEPDRTEVVALIREWERNLEEARAALEALPRWRWFSRSMHEHTIRLYGPLIAQLGLMVMALELVDATRREATPAPRRLAR